MCRVEERIYVRADGHRQMFENSFLCPKSKHGKLCSRVERTTEYFPTTTAVSRDHSSSPASYDDPPTPTGTETYLVQRRTSIVERRPCTREGPRPLPNEIVIEFGHKRDKSNKCSAVSVKKYKRSSLGAASVGSNDAAIDSPGSDTSATVRTGFADTPLLKPYQQPPGYTTRPAVPHSHRHTSSASSYTSSSQPPSLLATSEPNSPSGRRAARFSQTVVHNPIPPLASLSSTQTRAIAGPALSGPYQSNVSALQDPTPRAHMGSDGLHSHHYSDFHDRSGSSKTASGRTAAHKITDHANEQDRLRRQKVDSEKRRKGEEARRMAQEKDQIVQEKAQKAQEKAQKEKAQREAHERAQEEAKQVRFELGRAEARAKERSENQLAESEKRRAEEREEARRRKQMEQAARDERAAKEEKRAKADRLQEESARKEKQLQEAEAKQARESRPRDSRPPTRDPAVQRQHSCRSSITRAQAQERDRLLAETEAQMAREREATEQREREERAELLRQQQQTTQYYDPRGRDRYPATDGPGVGRRHSVSGRRPSISSGAPNISSGAPNMGLGRANSQRRASIIQPAPSTNPPLLNTTYPNQYSTRPANSQHQNQPMPHFSPPGSQQAFSRPPSARHASYQDSHFAQPLTRPNQDNLFAVAVAPLMPPRDPWDTRNLREALPQARQPPSLAIEPPHTLKRRGEDVISRAAADDRARAHDGARQATRNMGKIVGFEDEYACSDEEHDGRKGSSYGHGLGLGLGKAGKRKH